MVRKSGQELSHEAVLAGVDLDPLEVCAHGLLGGSAEPGYDGGDVLLFHRLGYFPAVHLGHPGRGPQGCLVVGARALPAAVAEGGE